MIDIFSNFRSKFFSSLLCVWRQVGSNGGRANVTNGPETAASLLAAGLDARAAELVSFPVPPLHSFISYFRFPLTVMCVDTFQY